MKKRDKKNQPGKSSSARRRPETVRVAAEELIDIGYAVCRIERGEKRPAYRRWATHSISPDQIGPGDGIGIVCGPVSGGDGHALVCIDLDAKKAVRLADEYLPPTGMVEGRPGKPRSHRWYLVPLAGVGDENKSHAAQTAPVMARVYGHPGPRTVSFRNPDKRELVRLIGTGGQAVVPPTLHTSGERREWESGYPLPPAVVQFDTLFDSVRRLAHRCGWTPKAVAEVADNSSATEEQDTSVDPFLTYRINRYLNELPASISGQGGHDACFRAACVLVWGFALSEVDALKFLCRFNARCRPKWSHQELLHKVRDSAAATDHEKPKGHLL